MSNSRWLSFAGSALLFVCAAQDGVAPDSRIHVDQVGYLVARPKIALVVAGSGGHADSFQVRSQKDGSVALQGKLSSAMNDSDSGDTVQAADFSSLRKPGDYYIEVPGVGRSYKFSIGDNVYARAYYLAMRSYYGQRCGTAVDLGPEFPGFKHATCHTDAAYHASSGRSGPEKSVKGWHDAGDFGRYIVNSGITTGTLLWAWEMYGNNIEHIGLKLPESGNHTPDILNEVRWNLDWMLSMQDSDGGVWHKQTSERFCGFIMPEDDKLASVVIGTGSQPYKSSCATADFAAVMATASRAYKTADPAYSDKCLKAAEAAWGWLEQNPNVTFRNPRGVSTGEYGDNNCNDEHLWASAELWRSTSQAPYQQYFLDHYKGLLSTVSPTSPPSWSDVAPLALWTFALAPHHDAAAAAEIQKASLAAADAIVARANQNGYRVSLTTHDYIWGSNGVLANYALQLLVANSMKPEPRYVDAALEDLHYMLGRNTFSLSYVTQVGTNYMKHPHHRPSGADKNQEPWPGLLSGGPNQRRQDAAMNRLPKSTPPAKSFLDDQESYATNEIAINWNAALVFLLAGVVR